MKEKGWPRELETVSNLYFQSDPFFEYRQG